MESITARWRNLGITRKFGLIFALLVVLVLLIGISAYSSFYSINRLGDRIARSNAVVQQVLDMDRGMEKARRLHGDFFVQYQRIGLQEAHEKYAQPSVREISRVIALSNDLKDMLFAAGQPVMNDIHKADVNLYLAYAKRFAKTSIEAVELISQRSAPDRGIENKMFVAFSQIKSSLSHHTKLESELIDARTYYKDYLISRKRYKMQSALNSLNVVEKNVEQNKLISGKERRVAIEQIRIMKILADKLLDIDLNIGSKLNDFSLQAHSIEPISKTLISKTREVAIQAEQQIDQAYLATRYIIVVSVVLSLIAIAYIAILVKTNISNNVLRLTRAANDLREGRLNVRIDNPGGDELGQLAAIFNDMAERLSDLIENLESKVAKRTLQLSLSEERFRKLVNELPQIAVQGINEKREIVYWNKTSEELFGYSETAALGRRFEQLLHPKYRQKEIAEAMSLWLAGGQPIPAAEQHLLDKNGREKPVYSAYEMQVSSQDERTIYCVHLDLAELRQAQTESEISESFYRQLFDHSSSGVAVYDVIRDGHGFILKDFNKAAEEIEQISREEVIGRSLLEVFPGARDLGLVDVLRKVWETGEPMHLPVTLYKDDRIEGWRENKVYKLPTGEVVSVYSDVTKQKKVEEERTAMELRLQRAQKMEAIGLMAGGIAHDLNNILSAIVGYPELLLLQLATDSDLRKPIEAIREAGERAAIVVADLLTVARGVASARSPAYLNDLVNEYLESPEFMQLQTSFPYVGFELDLSEGLPAIECSPVHVKKCIMNLAINGAEAIVNTGTIMIKTHRVDAQKEWRKKHGLEHYSFVVLTISDTGTGIAQKDVEHIFEPFYTKKVMGKRSGTGLGLSVVWNTMKEHNGIVEVRSSEAGTVFDLYFPEAEGRVAVLEDTITIDSVKGNGEKILIVDDEQAQCDLAKTILEHLGYRADYVLSGEEAIGYLQETDTDIILLDMLMDPGLNGKQTYKKIKEFRPDQKAIIASGFSENEDVKATLELGAGGFIKKPYTMLELGLALQKELNVAGRNSTQTG